MVATVSQNPFKKSQPSAPAPEPEAEELIASEPETEELTAVAVPEEAPEAEAPPKAEKPKPGPKAGPKGPPAPGAGKGPSGLPRPGGPAGPGPDTAILADDFVIDLSGIETQTLGIPIGDHLMVCDDVGIGQSQAGNPMLTFDLRVVTGEAEGKKQKAYCAITEKALWKLAEFTTALAIVGAKPGQPTVAEIKAQAKDRLLIGNFVADRNGGRYNQLSYVRGPEDSGFEPGTTLADALR